MVERREPMSPDKQGAKNASRALVRAVGGQEVCPGFARYKRHQTYSGFGNIELPDQFMPIDVVEDLEAVTRGTAGWPVVTRYLASRQGCAIVVLPEVEPCDASFMAVLGELTTEFSDMSTGLITALADAKVCETEIDDLKLIGRADDLIDVVVKVRAMLIAKRGG